MTFETETAEGPAECRRNCASWLELSATIFTALGAVATFGWLYIPGRDLSSLPAYFDPWTHCHQQDDTTHHV